MKKYSDKDLIRKPITRQIIILISIFCIIIGTRSVDYHGFPNDWKGILVIFIGCGLLTGLHFAYENLLTEKNYVRKK